MRSWSIIGSSALLLLALSGCSHEKSDWKAATTANTTDAYQHFVDQYPKSEHQADARGRIAQLQEQQDWQTATGADTRPAYEQYLAQHPDGPNAQEARIRIENFAQATAPVAASPPVAAASPPPVRARSVAKAPATHAGTGSAHYVQLGAFTNRTHAEQHWKEISHRFAKELKGLTPRYVDGKSHAARVVRLQVAVASRAEGKTLCQKLRAHAQACVVAGAG